MAVYQYQITIRGTVAGEDMGSEAEIKRSLAHTHRCKPGQVHIWKLGDGPVPEGLEADGRGKAEEGDL